MIIEEIERKDKDAKMYTGCWGEWSRQEQLVGGRLQNLRTDLGMMMEHTVDSIKFITENANTLLLHRGVGLYH